MKSGKSYTLAGLSAVLLIAGGCSRESTAPPTYAVVGVVTLSGQPVEGALVEFTPVAAADGMAGAQAQTDAAGRYEAATLRDNGKTVEPGLPAGEYRVTVRKLEAPAGDASLSSPPRNVLPPKYQSVDSSPLTAKVGPDGDNTVDIKL